MLKFLNQLLVARIVYTLSKCKNERAAKDKEFANCVCFTRVLFFPIPPKPA